MKILRELPYLVHSTGGRSAEGPEDIAVKYEPLMEMLLRAPSTTLAKPVNDDEKKKSMSMKTDDKNEKENQRSAVKDVKGVAKTTTTTAACSPLVSLVAVARRSKDVAPLIQEGTEASLEEAWMVLLRLFSKFDPAETNVVTPRQFCLAVSVLLDDDVLLSKDDWEQVIAALTVRVPVDDHAHVRAHAHAHAGAGAGARGNAHGGSSATSAVVAVDYMKFCECIVLPDADLLRELARESKRLATAAAKAAQTKKDEPKHDDKVKAMAAHKMAQGSATDGGGNKSAAAPSLTVSSRRVPMSRGTGSARIETAHHPHPHL